LKFDIRKLFARSSSGLPFLGGTLTTPQTPIYLPGHGDGEGLEYRDYQGLIASHFRRWGVSNQCVTIEVRKIGQAPDGFDVFVGMVRLVRWERNTRPCGCCWVCPCWKPRSAKPCAPPGWPTTATFTGLWLHASERMQVPDELRELLGALAPAQPGKRRIPG
jgi:hypothetical protein